MRSLTEFRKWKIKLELMGFKVRTPTLIDRRLSKLSSEQILKAKRADSLRHFSRIQDSDAILVLNYERDGMPRYIGGATFAEVAVAFFLHKQIFLVNPIPENTAYTEELRAWGVQRWTKLKDSRGDD